VPATPFQILLAEDNADDVFLMEQAFRKAAVPSRLHAVQDGLEALAYLRGEDVYADRGRFPVPDLLLLDLNMPRLNGFEVLETLRADQGWNRLPIFMLSASNLPADVRRAEDLHANAYVVKPNPVDDLVVFATTLQQWLRFTVHSRPSA
jgi:chemotaxis family two-component system response regulator Rcp1